MSLEQDLKIIKNAELDIELLHRDNEKKCLQNNDKIDELKEKIKSTEFILEEELKASGEKKIECKIGYCSYRTMPDNWEYDDLKIIGWCKEKGVDYFHTIEVVEKMNLKNDYKAGTVKDVPGLTITPQNPKFNYKIKR